VRCQCSKLVNIDLVAQTFEVELKLEAQWLVPELSPIYAVLQERHVSEHGDKGAKFKLSADDERSSQTKGYFYVVGDETNTRLFAPRLQFKNCVEMRTDECWYALRRWSADKPVVTWNRKCTGVFQEVMELMNFPFDLQALQVTLETGWERNHPDGNSVLVVKHPEYSSVVAFTREDFVQSSEYHLDRRILLTYLLTYLPTYLPTYLGRRIHA
jgi:hypothetical protein